MKSVLEYLASGHVALARISANGLNVGDTLYIDTQTAPTDNKQYIMYCTVSKVNQDGTFNTYECEPYFGYNTNWSTSQIVR